MGKRDLWIDVAKTKAALHEIVAMAEACPEPYREKCFELLLESYLEGQVHSEGGQEESVTDKPKTGGESHQGRPLSLPEMRDEFAPASGTEYVVMCGHWLEKHGGKEDGFDRTDIMKGLKELRCSFRNPSDSVSKAIAKGFLIQSGNKLMLSQKGITLSVSKMGAKA